MLQAGSSGRAQASTSFRSRKSFWTKLSSSPFRCPKSSRAGVATQTFLIPRHHQNTTPLLPCSRGSASASTLAHRSWTGKHLLSNAHTDERHRSNFLPLQHELAHPFLFPLIFWVEWSACPPPPSRAIIVFLFSGQKGSDCSFFSWGGGSKCASASVFHAGFYFPLLRLCRVYISQLAFECISVHGCVCVLFFVCLFWCADLVARVVWSLGTVAALIHLQW